MKLANVTPVYKKGNRSEKGNYRPASILPNISKDFERCIYKQMSQFFEGIISKYQCGFRKGHSAQHALISLLEKWRYNVDQGRMFGALLTDLSKAFDCLPHDIILAKLNAYGFDMKALNFIYDYLRNRKQRTKIDNAYSSWQNILYGVPQGSILGPLLFNIDLCDLFFVMNYEDIANYADDNTPYVSGKNIDEVVKFLEKSSRVIFKWFSDNQFQGNASKCHVLLSTDKHVQVKIGTAQIENSSSEELLGVTIDAKLNFVKHIEQIYAKARAKLKALARIAPFVNTKKKRVLMKAFFMAQSNYYPLTWMFYNRKLNNKINKLHERCLRIVYSDNTSSFEELLETDNSVSVYHENIQVLATELYKIVKELSPEIMKEVFPFNENTYYKTRNKRKFHSRSIKSVTFGSETLSHLACKIWELVPVEIKNVDLVVSFKRAIKKWKPINCPCRLCRTYVFQVGFV